MNKIVFYPTGALLSGETDEFLFKDEIAIALAGPFANFCVVIVCVFLWWIFPEFYNYSADLVVANLSLALFNLLPVYPMDGGRVLLAFLSMNYDRKKACKIAKIIALCFSCVLICIFVISCFFDVNVFFGIFGLVLFISSLFEDKNLAYKRIERSKIKTRKLLRGLKKVTLVFSADAKLVQVISCIDNFAIYEIEIVDAKFNKLAVFDENSIERLALCVPLGSTMGEICEQVAKNATTI